MSDAVGAHNGLHSEQGARNGEHPGRSRHPVIKVADLAWLEFEKPDLDRAEAFARAFGFQSVLRTSQELQLRGTDAGAPCVVLRRGPRSRFVGVAFKAQDRADVRRLADATGAPTRALPETFGGLSSTWWIRAASPCTSWRAPTSWRPCPASSRTNSTSATHCAAPTPPSGHRACPAGCSGSGMWFCRRPTTSRR